MLHMDLGFPETISGSVVTVPTRTDCITPASFETNSRNPSFQLTASCVIKMATHCLFTRLTHLGTLSEAKIRVLSWEYECTLNMLGALVLEESSFCWLWHANGEKRWNVVERICHVLDDNVWAHYWLIGIDSLYYIKQHFGLLFITLSPWPVTRSFTTSAPEIFGVFVTLLYIRESRILHHRIINRFSNVICAKDLKNKREQRWLHCEHERIMLRVSDK